jgi:uncharacterized membrane protein
MGNVLAAAAVFVGTHFLLSHPLRRALVARIGEGPFLGLYSLVAAVTLVWLALAYRAAPMSPLLWPVGDGLWAVATAIMLLASVLLMGSLIGNPALPDANGPDPTGAQKTVPEARGVFAITRHPMMWSFALWSLAHVMVLPEPSNIVLCVAVAFLALVGAVMQDRKKEALQPDFWRTWERRTSYWPLAAIAAGRARLAGFRGHDLGGGLVVWLAASWAHLPLAGWAAGVWRWV